MTSRCESPAGPEFYYFSDPDVFPVTSRPVRHVIPAGTVASRILDLQNRAECVSSSNPLPTPSHGLENSRTGYGRRLGAAFGQPASRSSKPDEQVQLNAKHSFLGLTTSRVNHMEEHAIVDGKSNWDRTAGLHSQLKPGGLGTRVQFEATSPWGFSSGSKSYSNIRQEYTQYDMDTLLQEQPEVHFDAMETCSIPENSVVSGDMEASKTTQGKDQDHVISESKQPKFSNQGEAMSPERMSFYKAAAKRRQSVKDLYRYYGMQRPAGLFSSDTRACYAEETATSEEKERVCHICSRVNTSNSTICKCGHDPCQECDDPAVEVSATSDGSAECGNDSQKLKKEIIEDFCQKGSSSRDLNVFQGGHKANKQHPRLDHQAQETWKISDSDHVENKYIEPEVVPALHLEQVTLHRGSQNIIPHGVNLQEPVRPDENLVAPLRTQGDAQKAPPKAILSTGALNLITLDSTINQNRSQEGHHGRRWPQRATPHSNSSSGTDSTSGGDNNHDSSRHTAQHGNRAGGLAVPSLRRRRRYPEETDSGYVAGTSYLEELDTSQQSAYHQSRLEDKEYNYHIRREEQPASTLGNSDSSQMRTSHHERSKNIYRYRYVERSSLHPSDSAGLGGIKYEIERPYQASHEKNSSKNAPSMTEQVESYHYLYGRSTPLTNARPSRAGRCQQCEEECTCKVCQPRPQHARSYIRLDQPISHDYFAPRRAISSGIRARSPQISQASNPPTYQQTTPLQPPGHITTTTIIVPAPQIEIVTRPTIDESILRSSQKATRNQDVLATSLSELRSETWTTLKGKGQDISVSRPSPPPIASENQQARRVPVEDIEGSLVLKSSGESSPIERKDDTSLGEFHQDPTTPPLSEPDSLELPLDPSPPLPQPKSPLAPKLALGTAEPAPVELAPIEQVAVELAAVDLLSTSPRRSQPASRRLSTFLLLQQEPQGAAQLQRRLQEHQEELKRGERTRVEEANRDLEESGLEVRQEGMQEEETKTSPSPPPPAEEMTMVQADESTTDYVEEHAASVDVATVEGEKVGARNGRVAGITVLIHMKGREDIVIKADLS